MNERTCHSCGDPVLGRRKFCPDCKKRAHAKAERERYYRGEDPADSPLDQGPVVDMTGIWAASRPPDFSGVTQTTQQQYAEPDVVDYSRGGFEKPGMYSPRNALAGVPGAVRRDLVRAQQMARDLAPAEEPQMSSWDELSASPGEQAWMVSFGRQASFREQPTVTPSPYAQAILGQAVTVTRPRPARADGQQRLPHIVN